MNVSLKNGNAVISGVSLLSLPETLDCGQCFRFFPNGDGSYTGTAMDRTVTVFMNADRLTISPCTESDIGLWQSFFDLDTDYGLIRNRLADIHPVLREAAEYAPGIRILRQQPFEALISFIISQNNNIKRIAGIIDRLCTQFGKPLADGGHAFPTPQTLAILTPDDLAGVRAGFRARYIIDAAQRVSSGELDLEALRTLPYNQAQSCLMQITGVGIKVADCTLLYGLHRLESFPLDVWMKRAMDTLFCGMSPDDFGEYAGIAQQYIFHYSRRHPELFS